MVGNDEDLTRDYFRVEDAAGHRFWLFREGLYGRETAAPRWYLHGVLDDGYRDYQREGDGTPDLPASRRSQTRADRAIAFPPPLRGRAREWDRPRSGLQRMRMAISLLPALPVMPAPRLGSRAGSAGIR